MKKLWLRILCWWYEICPKHGTEDEAEWRGQGYCRLCHIEYWEQRRAKDRAVKAKREAIVKRIGGGL